MIRCEAMTKTGRCCAWAHDGDDAALCRFHRYVFKNGAVVRLTGRRQIRRTYDINGNNPQTRVAYVGFDNDKRQEIAA